MRYLASTAAKDVRRYRLFEKALDALATSPYARTVRSWVFAGAAAPLHAHTRMQGSAPGHPAVGECVMGVLLRQCSIAG